MPRRVHRAPRKRSGCAVCKTAHVRCTEEKPECRRCQRLSLSCQYAFRLLWEEDALQRNIVHGRAGVWTRDGKKKKTVPGASKFADGKEDLVWVPLPGRATWDFSNFSPEDFRSGLPLALQHESLSEGEEVAAEQERMHKNSGISEGHDVLERVNEGLMYGIVDRNVEEAGEVECTTSLSVHKLFFPITWTFKFDPHLFIPTCPPLVHLSGLDTQLLEYYVHELSPKCSLNVDLNPYLNVLLPVAYEFEPLRHTLLAASACQLYHFSGDRRYELHSLRHRSKAICGLNRHLNKEHMNWKSLATMVMFCFRDITDGCEPSWITHLRMGLRMLKDLLCTTPIDRELRKFCEMYFVAHDVMGRTAWDDAENIEHYEWDQDESYNEIDSIMGCSRELISLISQISCLAGMTRQQTDLASHTAATAADLMSRLCQLRQTLRTGVGHAETMLQIAEVKRLSAMLYLHDRVMAPHTDTSTTLANGLRNAIIEAIRQLPASSGASLWPLFILGKSNMSTHEQGQFVLDRLQQLEESRYLGSFHHARRRVERNIMRRLTAQGDALQRPWEDDAALNDNERWVSLA